MYMNQIYTVHLRGKKWVFKNIAIYFNQRKRWKFKKFSSKADSLCIQN